ncbi:MAG: hypothetical protein ACPGYK_03910, partial [Flavobacteriales bacterium]
MRSHILVAFALTFFAGLTFAQSYTMTIEEFAVDGVPGTTTYRFYMDMLNPDDELSGVFGNASTPLSINTTNGFYNDAAALGSTADGINPLFLAPPFDASFPFLPYDSWATIGISQQPGDGEAEVLTIEDPNTPWIGTFDASSTLSGQDVSISDEIGGAWFVVPGSTNGIPDATNQRVLFAQITADAPPSGTVNLQFFPNGDGDRRFGFHFDGPGVYTGFCIATEDFPCDSEDVPGCMDSTACNFNADATTDDGSCAIADDPCEICNADGGVTLQDADEDGVCDGDEIAGCQDSTACNFDADATDAGTCVFADDPCEICNADGGVTLQDADEDGVCDGDEITGCQDSTACNYNPDATDAG